jgi:hypothetical protein
MTLAVRTGTTWSPSDPRRRTGDLVAELARKYAALMNESDFARDLCARRVSRDRYLAFISTMYPCVVGFNRALIRSISKVDHVRHSSFVKVLAEQLQEEQAHNQIWRTKLEVHGIDHEALYGALEDYLARFSATELEQRTLEVVEALRRDVTDTAPGIFPDPVFPEPVIALYHHLWMTASYDAVNYWEHFACQCGIEMVIYDVVSATVLPGVLGNPALDAGPATTQWWREHGKLDTPEFARRIDEEKHLELSRIALNRSETANLLRERVVARAEDAMRLFAATLLCQHRESARFPLQRYLKRASASA